MGVSSFNAVPYALYAPTDNRVDSLIDLFEHKFNLIKRPLQESLNIGIPISELIDVGFHKDQFYGLNYQGGFIFYIGSTNSHGLVTSFEEIGYCEWEFVII